MALLISIGGGSGSGKTYITKRIMKELGEENVGHLSYDYYYKNRTDLTFEERSKVNYDSPDSLDEDLFLKHILALKNDEEIEIPQYDFANHLRKPKYIKFTRKPIVIVDGILVYTLPNYEELFDYTIFVDTDSDLRFARRLFRDIKERGRTAESVFEQYLATVRPMHLRYVEPYKNSVDFTFKNNKQDGIDENIFNALMAELKHIINKAN